MIKDYTLEKLSGMLDILQELSYWLNGYLSGFSAGETDKEKDFCRENLNGNIFFLHAQILEEVYTYILTDYMNVDEVKQKV